MTFVSKRKIGTQTLSGFYTSVKTEGDASRFIGAETGYREIIHKNDSTPDGAPSSLSLLFTLSFNYLVGSEQLVVLAKPGHSLNTFGVAGYVLIPKEGSEPTGSVSLVTYEEVNSTTVRVKFSSSQIRDAATDFMFMVPHTATPAVSREKLLVKDQGDNIAVEMEGDGDGVLLKSPSGLKWLLRVDDSGNIVTEAR